MEYNNKVNGYCAYDTKTKGTDETEELRDVRFVYYCDGTEFARSMLYEGVPAKRVKKAEDKLNDYTLYNLNQTSMANVIPFITIVNEVERIIFDKK